MSPRIAEEPVSQTAATVDRQLRRVRMPGLKGDDLRVTGDASGTADEMARVCAFLASGDAACITGQRIFVDGGPTLYAYCREPWSSA
jgi:NAD(P)-dependent dehydrogenase (short-subunit alcohol dehydrogenase family)